MGVAMVVNKTCKFLMCSGATLEEAANRQFCGTVRTTGESFFAGDLSFLLPYGSNMTSLFTRATLQLRAEGELVSLEKYFQVHTHPCSFHKSISLSVGRLKIFFLMAFGACGVLLAIMVCDRHGIRKFDGGDQESVGTKDSESVYGKEDNDCGDNSESDVSNVGVEK